MKWYAIALLLFVVGACKSPTAPSDSSELDGFWDGLNGKLNRAMGLITGKGDSTVETWGDSIYLSMQLGAPVAENRYGKSDIYIYGTLIDDFFEIDSNGNGIIESHSYDSLVVFGGGSYPDDIELWVGATDYDVSNNFNNGGPPDFRGKVYGGCLMKGYFFYSTDSTAVTLSKIE